MDKYNGAAFCIEVKDRKKLTFEIKAIGQTQCQARLGMYGHIYKSIGLSAA